MKSFRDGWKGHRPNRKDRPAGRQRIAQRIGHGSVELEDHERRLPAARKGHVGDVDAGDAARFHHQGSTEPTDDIASPLRKDAAASPLTKSKSRRGGGGHRGVNGGYVALESGVPMEVQRALAQKGHDVRFESDGFGGYQAIFYDAARDLYMAGSDFRKDGCAAGY